MDALTTWYAVCAVQLPVLFRAESGAEKSQLFPSSVRAAMGTGTVRGTVTASRLLGWKTGYPEFIGANVGGVSIDRRRVERRRLVTFFHCRGYEIQTMMMQVVWCGVVWCPLFRH